MKDKIIIFIVGLLLGAIISTGSIYFYTVANNSGDDRGEMQMQGGNPPSMNGNQNGQPPELPNENNMPNSNNGNS